MLRGAGVVGAVEGVVGGALRALRADVKAALELEAEAEGEAEAGAGDA